MNNEQLADMALETLQKLSEFAANQKGAAAERLEAMAKVTASIPWDEVATLSIGWKAVEYNDADGGQIELLPELHVVMKEQMS